MNVSTMISLMRTLALGQVSNDADSKAIALQYLNLANDELYRETASINSNVLENENHVSTAGVASIVLLQQPLLISRAYLNSFKYFLDGKSNIEFYDYQFCYPDENDPKIYTNTKSVFYFWPHQNNVAYNLNILYTPERDALEENTPESSVPYPVSYHGILVDGALYYLFQDESGFKNPRKEEEAYLRWMKGKSNLTSYFYGANKQTISTFRNA